MTTNNTQLFRSNSDDIRIGDLILRQRDVFSEDEKTYGRHIQVCLSVKDNIVILFTVVYSGAAEPLQTILSKLNTQIHLKAFAHNVTPHFYFDDEDLVERLTLSFDITCRLFGVSYRDHLSDGVRGAFNHPTVANQLVKFHRYINSDGNYTTTYTTSKQLVASNLSQEIITEETVSISVPKAMYNPRKSGDAASLNLDMGVMTPPDVIYQRYLTTYQQN